MSADGSADQVRRARRCARCCSSRPTARTGTALAIVTGFDEPAAIWARSARGAGTTPAPSDRPPASCPTSTSPRSSTPRSTAPQIPMFLIHRAGVTRRAPTTPAILNGYGGFAITESPVWSPTIARLVRGGRPVRRSPDCAAGPSTARSGTTPGAGRNKQNVFDDFHAAADWLVDDGLHRPRAAGDRRRVERRPAGRRRAHAAARPVPGGVVRRAAARHGALPAVPDRPAVDRRVRRPRRRRGVRLAARLLAVPPRARRTSSTRRCCSPPPRATPGSIRCMPARWRPLLQSASGDDDATGAAVPGGPSRPRRRQAGGQARRRAGRRAGVPVVAARRPARPLRRRPVRSAPSSSARPAR